MRAIDDNLQAVRERIARAAAAAGRDPGSVTLLAVSKTQPASFVAQAAAAGQRSFGENYVQEAIEKMDAFAATALAPSKTGVEWHLIGPLQSNKTRIVAERFHWVQSLESEKVARRLSDQRPANLPPLNVLIQLNVSGEASKSGIAPGDVLPLARAINTMPRLKLRGLMAIPEPGAGVARYRELKRLYDELKDEFQFDTLSVGMSDDMENAIAGGSTMVRVGTAIFGARQKAASAA